MEVIITLEQKQIKEFLKGAGDIITSCEVTEAGFHRSVLAGLVKENELARLSRGIYMKPTAWEDEMYLLQHRYSRGVFSHETSLYLHDMSDRTPARFTMTFPWGYNATSLKNENVIVKRTVKDLYPLGITTLQTAIGNTIRVYDIERTLCDIVRGNNACEISIVVHAMKSYASSPSKDIQKLMTYAEMLRVKPKILNYMEVLL